MAIETSVQITLEILGDGSSTTVDLDLMTHPFIVWGINDVNNVIGAKPVNWFSDIASGKRPNGLSSFTISSGPVVTASLSGTVLTLTFASAPPASPTTTQVSVQLTFAGD